MWKDLCGVFHPNSSWGAVVGRASRKGVGRVSRAGKKEDGVESGHLRCKGAGTGGLGDCLSEWNLSQVGWPAGEPDALPQGINCPGHCPHPGVSSQTARLGYWSLSGQLGGRGAVARREMRSIH